MTTSREATFLSLTQKVDPEWRKARLSEPEYEFTGRTFTANRTIRGAYGPDTDKAILGTEGFALYTDGGLKVGWSGASPPGAPPAALPETFQLVTDDGHGILIGDAADEALELE